MLTLHTIGFYLTVAFCRAPYLANSGKQNANSAGLADRKKKPGFLSQKPSRQTGGAAVKSIRPTRSTRSMVFNDDFQIILI
jgi:hypothetical protein